MPPARTPIADRFWKHVRKGSGCWIWTAATNSVGYGIIGAGGQGAGMLYAHRVSYELERGPIPDSLVIDHLCRVTLCVRPDHLEVVTVQVNTQRGFDALRANGCKSGHDPKDVYRKKNGNIAYCRECHRLAAQALRDRAKAS